MFAVFLKHLLVVPVLVVSTPPARHEIVAIEASATLLFLKLSECLGELGLILLPTAPAWRGPGEVGTPGRAQGLAAAS